MAVLYSVRYGTTPIMGADDSIILNEGERKVLRVTKKWEKKDSFFLFILLILTCVFNLFLVDKFYTITEGWFQDFANYIKDGKVPYRDFYLFIPPFWPALMTLISTLSDNTFLYFRIYGVLERIIVVTISFIILHHSFRSDHIFIALLAASAVYISNLQDLFYGYYQTALLLVLILIWLSILICESVDTKKRTIYAIVYGTLAGITTMAKLPAGVIMFCILTFITFFTLYKRGENALRTTIISIASYLISIFLCLIPWVILGAFNPMIEQLLKGSSSKGSLFTILFGFFPKIITADSVSFLVLMVLLSAGIYLNVHFSHQNRVPTDGLCLCQLVSGAVETILVVLIFIPFYNAAAFSEYFYAFPPKFRALLFSTIVMGILCAVLKTKNDQKTEVKFSRSLARCSVISFTTLTLLLSVLLWYIMTHDLRYLNYSNERQIRQGFHYALFFFETALAVLYFVQLISGNTEEKATKLLIVSAAWGIMYIHGMSNLIEDHAMLLSLSFVICALLEIRFAAFNKLKNALVYVLCIFIFTSIFVQRCYVPYHWWGVETIDNVYVSTFTYKDGKLAGLRGSESATEALNEIYDIVLSTKKEGDTMFSFPHISYFNVMSDLRNDLFAKTHFFDVCSDKVAASDAECLLREPPTYIVWMDISENAWNVHEDLFRNGNMCGQREIKNAYEELVNTGEYQLLWDGVVGSSDPIFVWRKY